MDQKIDDAAYNEGRADFVNGLSLRAMVERSMLSNDEVKAMSAAIGFADAFLDCLRGLAR